MVVLAFCRQIYNLHCAKSRLYAIYDVQGITLTTLVITIVVLLILASVATYTGIEAIDNTKRTKFIAELKIMQSHVNQWYEDCKPNNVQNWSDNIQAKFSGSGAIWLGSSETNDSAIIDKAKNTLSAAGVTLSANNFYYLSSNTLNSLGVEGVSQDVLVSIQDRKVVSYLGLKYKNAMYYTIDSLDGENGIDAIYNVDYTNPNSGQPSFSVKSESIEPGISKITIYDINYTTGYNTKWKVYYKKDYDTDWQSSDDLSFRVTQDGVYTIKLTNQNGDIVGTATAEIGSFSYKTKNSTLASSTDKATMNSKNPVIPQGFKAVDTDTAKWKYTDNTYSIVQGWNDGLVIEDDIGNQFVWVPCSLNEITQSGQPTIVAYSKNFNYPSNYSASDLNTCNAFDTTTVGGVTYKAIPVRENEQVNTYGGFYVARFEAGLPTESLSQSAELNNVYTSIPVSKYGSKLWNYIDYTHSYVNAEKMINNTSKYGTNKSGLITGTQWDTIIKWYETNNIPVLKTNQNWGSYFNLSYNTNGLYYKEKETTNWLRGSTSSSTSELLFHASGLNSDGYKKNIADLGGNLWEWSSEMVNQDSGNENAFRGGAAHLSCLYQPTSYRYKSNNRTCGYHVGFRVVLYIQDEPQKEYVTDGLLAYYDAENNTGTGHSTNTTTWKDLSGNNNDATLYNFATTATEDSGWHSNYLAFDGENDFASKTGITVDGANGTIEIIGKYIYGHYIFRSDASGARTYIRGADIVKGNDTKTAVVTFNNNSPITSLASRVLKYYTQNNKSFTSNYYNMNKSQEEEFNGISTGSYISICSFLPSSWSQGTKMQVYAVRIYNRALTEEEIRQNYEIDKVRFNIQE